MPRRLAALMFVLPLLLAPAAVEAAPVDAKVGQSRAVFRRAGTRLRAEPKALSELVVLLPARTTVTVQEVSLPWIRVRANVGGNAHQGWLKALETVETTALAPNQRLERTSQGTGAVSRRDASAAGRQLDASTERRYRAGRADLAAAYASVDAMQRETEALDPIDALAFIMDARLGRRGHDYDRPGRVKPDHRKKQKNQRSNRGAGGLIGSLGGELVKRLGGSSRDADVVRKGLDSATNMARQLSERFTPEQEYYLGRAVAAEAIAQFGVDPDAARRRYVRLVGESVVRLTNRLPANFGGYHFEVLDSDVPNGVSGPGGFVLITRGAVDACETEDELAGVLAHELAHVRLKHGEGVLRKGKSFQALVKGLAETGATATGIDDDRFAAGLVELLGTSASEIVRTSTENGYGRQLEFEADREGTWILFDVYYDHVALRDTLLRLQARDPGRQHTATHGSPGLRAGALEPIVGALAPFTPRDGVRTFRKARFDRRGP